MNGTVIAGPWPAVGSNAARIFRLERHRPRGEGEPPERIDARTARRLAARGTAEGGGHPLSEPAEQDRLEWVEIAQVAAGTPTEAMALFFDTHPDLPQVIYRAEMPDGRTLFGRPFASRPEGA